MSIKLYVEGGGDSKSLRTACRKGFRIFIEKAELAGRMPRIVASGGRQQAYNDFTTAHAQAGNSAMLLVDAEGRVTAAGPWEHLMKRDRWRRPPGATDDQCHLMVQVMESWFLADRETLKMFYGRRFNANALPNNLVIEEVSKQDVVSRLKQATQATQKGRYSKGSHSFEILANLDPTKVRNASPYADRFMKTLLELG